MNLDQNYKNKIEEELVKTIATGLEQGRILPKDTQGIADFILGRIDQIASHEQLTQFLSELSFRWPVFSALLSFEQKEAAVKTAKEAADLAKQGKIEEALDLAKAATNS